MIKPQTLKGFRDFLPDQARKRQYVINKLKTVFETYGFEPLETPTLEYEEILAGKYGDEGEQLMYRFEDNGKRRVAMRYDQTVPTARVVAQYAQELPTPFKRYQIQNVWRAENTQKGRYREFTQCDLDIIGVSSPLADGEIIAAAAAGLDALGFKSYRIVMNDRRVFSELIENGSVTETEMNHGVIAIDKLKKIGQAGVLAELVSKGIAEDRAMQLLNLIRDQEKTDTLQDIDAYLSLYPELKKKCVFDPTLARGLSYYTGIIFEIIVDDYPVGSVCGGGRYDELIGMFAKQSIPAVGFAYGFDRVLEAMEELNLFPEELANATAKVLVTIFSDETKQTSIETSSRLRSNGINTELYLGEIKQKNPLEKQLKYAIQKHIPYVIIIGPEEAEKNVVNLKSIETREQQTRSLEEVIKRIKNS